MLASTVAEHMPEEQVPTFITTLFRHARKFVWASVYIRPAKKCVLGSDITPHATLRSMEWWQEQCTAASGGAPFHWVETS